MNRVYCTLAAVLITVAILCSAATASGKPGPGAFLKYRVDSVGGLVDQIAKEPRVAKLYVEHFHTSAEAFRDYVQKNVELITLKKPVVATVYFTAKGGGIGRDTRVLPAGTRVFATKKGDLLLEWRCGNPLSARLPAVMTSKAVESHTKVTKTAVGSAVKNAQAAPVAPTTVAVVPAAVTSPETPVATAVEGGTGEATMVNQAPAVSVLPSVETLGPPPVTPVVPAAAAPAAAATAPPAVAAVSSGGGKFPWVPALILGAGAGLFAGGGGHDNPPSPTPEPVPEPTSIAVVAMSLAGFGFKVTTRRR